MSEMVERLSSAIRTYAVRIWGAPHLYAVVKASEWDKPLRQGMDAAHAYNECARLNARAAIEAMREPTEIMKEIGDAIIIGDVEEKVVGSFTAEKTWVAMIDVALLD